MEINEVIKKGLELVMLNELTADEAAEKIARDTDKLLKELEKFDM